jgi:Fic family protein
MVRTLCAKINTQLSSSTTTLEKLILSFEAHYELVNIHPFYDGNGRTSRLLSNAIQNYFGLPLAIVHSEDKVEYIESLIASRNTDTTLPFLNFMFEQYEKHLENQIQLFQQG